MITEVKDLTPKDYTLIARLVYEKSGIHLGNEKMSLVRARLGKRVRQGNFGSFRSYYNYVSQDASGEELGQLLDAISTNTTHLFREERHFKFLRELLRKWVGDKQWRQTHSAVRIWSAGCSSGEEPHSIAMVVHDTLQDYPNLEKKILATDLSIRMLSKARLGLYESHRVGTVPPQFRQRYFTSVRQGQDAYLQLVPELRRLIRFAHFNLMTPTFPFKHGFDVIFCRNVMIYFDRPTQEQLVRRFAGQLHAGGHLLIGHSESLSNIEHSLEYVEPTTYRK
ncbi:MAG: protein-glutamate O-methyltransferase [Planctomycetes bacterium]|nr:protein-glutamate O-methyltransferase [Planctomycetota bacterium]